jgi:hypothetical protein
MSKPFGLPLWREFLESASHKLIPEDKLAFQQLWNLAGIDLALVAEFLHSRLRGRLREDVIETFNKSQRWNPEECLIPWLGVQKVITTNYDRVLDSLFPWLIPVIPATAASDFQEIRCLVKLHGRVEDPDSVVLTRSQYVRAYTDQFWAWLKEFSNNNTYIFLGCSLTEDDFLRALKPVATETAPRHFAIIPTRSDEESRRLSNFFSGTYGIETISYDADKHGYGVIKELLLSLVPPLRAAARQIPRISNEAELELAWKNYQFSVKRSGIDRNDRVAYLIALLDVIQSSVLKSVMRRDIFEELLKYWEVKDAWSKLLETASDSQEDTNRVLQQRERLRPLFSEDTESLPESSDPPVRKYYRAFRAGNHTEAKKWLEVLKNRPTADRDRIAVLNLQNSLIAGSWSAHLLEQFEKSLTNNGRRLYLDYGLGLFYLWNGDLDRARRSFRAARLPWRWGRSAFISWQEAICEILAKDFMTARVKLEAVAVDAFLPLGPAGDLIRRSGGSELSMELRRTTSKELYCLIWFFRSLTARAMRLGDEASERHDSTVRLIESIQEEDLLLTWFLYSAGLLKEQHSEALRIELEHRTHRSPGIRILLDAVNVLLTTISSETGARFSASIAAAVRRPPSTKG